MMKSFAQWCGAKSFTSMREVQMAQEAWDYQQERIDNLEQWIAGIADDHGQIPDWIQQSARSLLAQEGER